jgi:hypothetical protein
VKTAVEQLCLSSGQSLGFFQWSCENSCGTAVSFSSIAAIARAGRMKGLLFPWWDAYASGGKLLFPACLAALIIQFCLETKSITALLARVTLAAVALREGFSQKPTATSRETLTATLSSI